MNEIHVTVHYYLISRLATLLALLYLVYVHLLQADHQKPQKIDQTADLSWIEMQQAQMSSKPSYPVTRPPTCCSGLLDVLKTNWDNQMLTIQTILRTDADPDQMLTVIICCMIARNSLDLGFTFALKYWADKNNLRGLTVWAALQLLLYILFGFPETLRLPVLLRGSYAWATSLGTVAAVCIGTWFEGMALVAVGLFFKSVLDEREKQQSKLRLLEHMV